MVLGVEINNDSRLKKTLSEIGAESFNSKTINKPKVSLGISLPIFYTYICKLFIVNIISNTLIEMKKRCSSSRGPSQDENEEEEQDFDQMKVPLP